MPRKPKPKDDRHLTKSFSLRLNALLRKQLDKLSEKNVSTITTEIVIAIRERLERNQLWPPQ